MLFPPLRSRRRDRESQVRRKAPSQSRAVALLECLEGRLLLALTVTPYDVTTPDSNLTNPLVVPNSGLNVTGTSYVGLTGQSGTYTGMDLSDGQSSVSLPDGIILTNGLASRDLTRTVIQAPLATATNQTTWASRATRLSAP
jgi:hypothetical protein